MSSPVKRLFHFFFCNLKIPTHYFLETSWPTWQQINVRLAGFCSKKFLFWCIPGLFPIEIWNMITIVMWSKLMTPCGWHFMAVSGTEINQVFVQGRDILTFNSSIGENPEFIQSLRSTTFSLHLFGCNRALQLQSNCIQSRTTASMMWRHGLAPPLTLTMYINMNPITSKDTRNSECQNNRMILKV